MVNNLITPEHLQRNEGESPDDFLIRLYENRENYEIDRFTIANLMNQELGTEYGESKFRKDHAAYRRWVDYFNDKKGAITPDDVKYNETTEIKADGSYASDKLIYMSEEDEKDPDFLLQAHGYDPSKWELMNAKSSVWNQHNKQDGTLTLYASKITAKPNESGFDVEAFLSKANKEIKPIHRSKKISDGEKLLEIPLYDLHFGVNTYDFYKDVHNKISDKIASEKWDRVLFIVGQDLLHNNGFSGQTSAGTPIEQVDMEDAWDNAWKFYCELLLTAQNNANNVDVSYSIANHDDSMAWAFVRALEVRFPDATFDTSKKMRKSFVWNDIFIGYAHGHKGANRLHENFLSDFGKQMALAKVVEIHTGHLHAEKAKDKFGVLVRTLSTGAQTDSWHDDQGFVGSHKRFQIFEYSPSALEAIYYI